MSAHVSGVSEGRLVVRCDSCLLVQFAAKNGNCRKCGQALAEPEETLEQPSPERPKPEPEPVKLDPIDIAFACKTLRKWRGWSQKDMARVGGYVRTYISKLENGKTHPTMSNIDRLSATFGVAPRDFMALATIGTETATRFSRAFRSSADDSLPRRFEMR